MPNMSYCRFQNTYKDLADCYDHMEDNLTEDEFDARIAIFEMARDIIEMFPDTLELPEKGDQ